MKKKYSSLQRKKLLNNRNMQRIQLHIELSNCFSPKGYKANCGACIFER